MKVFMPSPEARITARSETQTQAAGGSARIHVTVDPGGNFVAHPAQVDGTSVATVLVGKKGQPRRTSTFVAGNRQAAQPAPLLIEEPVVAPIVQHIGRSLKGRSPWRAALAQLSWMPHTDFGNKAGLHAFARISRSAVDWLIFSAGLVIGIAALPTIYPIVRCVAAHKAVSSLQDGMADLQLANQLLQMARDLPEVTMATAQNILQVYRGQACRPRLLCVKHRSGWSLFAETELLKYLDEKVPGVSLQVRAQDIRDNRNAMLLNMGAYAVIIATQPAPVNRAQAAGNCGQIVAQSNGTRLNWNRFANTALLISAYS